MANAARMTGGSAPPLVIDDVRLAGEVETLLAATFVQSLPLVDKLKVKTGHNWSPGFYVGLDRLSRSRCYVEYWDESAAAVAQEIDRLGEYARVLVAAGYTVVGHNRVAGGRACLSVTHGAEEGK